VAMIGGTLMALATMVVLGIPFGGFSQEAAS
jgi:hypothetical protein